MATTELAAHPRSVLGKKVSQLRRRGLVPCNVYGRSQQSTPLQAPERELKHVVRSAGHTGLVSISVEGESAPRTAVVREIQRFAMTGELKHVAFQQVSMTEKMNVRIPVQLVGAAPVVDQDGLVVQALDYVDVECLPGDIPQHLDADISRMAAFDAQLHISDIKVPASVTVLSDPALVVAYVTRQAVAEEEEAAAEQPAEAAPAGGEEPAAEGTPAES